VCAELAVIVAVENIQKPLWHALWVHVNVRHNRLEPS
jgi:hypothetical protein